MPATKDSMHWKYWKYTLDELSKMKFVDKTTGEVTNRTKNVQNFGNRLCESYVLSKICIDLGMNKICVCPKCLYINVTTTQGKYEWVHSCKIYVRVPTVLYIDGSMAKINFLRLKSGWTLRTLDLLHSANGLPLLFSCSMLCMCKCLFYSFVCFLSVFI